MTIENPEDNVKDVEIRYLFLREYQMIKALNTYGVACVRS